MAEKRCFAPVFKAGSFFACLFLYILAPVAIVLLILLGLLLGTGLCPFKQFIYRLTHCREGNSNPEIPL